MANCAVVATAYGIAKTELPIIILAPAFDQTIFQQGAGMGAACNDLLSGPPRQSALAEAETDQE